MVGSRPCQVMNSNFDFISESNNFNFISQGPPLNPPLKWSDSGRVRNAKFKHIIHDKWNSLHLLNSDTVTGINQEKLVIKADVLKPGQTYAVVLYLQDSGNELHDLKLHEVLFVYN